MNDSYIVLFGFMSTSEMYYTPTDKLAFSKLVNSCELNPPLPICTQNMGRETMKTKFGIANWLARCVVFAALLCYSLIWAGIVGCVSYNRPLINPITRLVYTAVLKHASGQPRYNEACLYNYVF